MRAAILVTSLGLMFDADCLAASQIRGPGADTPVAVDKRTEAADRNVQSDRASVEALEREWLAHESDRATLERILAADFVHVVPAGLFLNKEQHISWAVQHPRPKNRHAKFEDLRVRVNGDTAIATGIVASADESGGDVRCSIFTDIFVFREGGWQAVNAQENAIMPGG